MVERAPNLLLSPIVVGELKAGFAVSGKRRANVGLLQRFLASPRVSLVPIDERVTDGYATIYRQLRSQGTPIPTNDLWIAACVKAEGEALFSFDAHFEHVSGLPIIRSEGDLLALLS